eukprot:TRINITY_DN3196_c0_g1_i2.p1 TRINITY_DN3196_c0_g1~~TRINITY_DN3196_c0_g1_i2.p1  ORF type:complete len:228 (-),score=27.77 TRINITY_DN3196_c0_g1_i2:94-777(-)
MEGGDIKRWYESIPTITRNIFTASLIITLAANFGLLSPYLLILDWDFIIFKFHVWRLITPFFYFGKLGFPFLISLMFLYRHSGDLEREKFANRQADYLFMILFGGGLLLIVSFFLGFRILGQGLIMFIIYNWAQTYRDAVMSFFFGLKFKGIYFPWVLMGFNLLMGGSPIQELSGAVIGHLYYFLTELYPANSGKYYLKTPEFIKAFFGNQNQQGQHGQWGRGYRLN